MLRFALLFVAIIGAIKSSAISEGRVGKVEIISNINDYLRANPEAKLVPLTRDLETDGIPYTVGARQSGDSLLGEASADQTYSSPQNVTDTLNYPQSGTGGVITYLEILLEQSPNTLAKTFVTSGGIGQRTLNLVIECFDTSIFRQRTRIYGFP